MLQRNLLIGALLVLGTLVFAVVLKQAEPPAPIPQEEATFIPPVTDEPFAYRNMIVVDRPIFDDRIESPFMVHGKARGPWFFEASFPIHVVDGNGEELGAGIASAEGEWMTDDYVSFSATVEFRSPTSERGTLVLEKDNPSGLPEHADAYRIPVRFR